MTSIPCTQGALEPSKVAEPIIYTHASESGPTKVISLLDTFKFSLNLKGEQSYLPVIPL